MNEEYLPLFWLKNYKSDYTELFCQNLSVQEMRILTENKYPEMRKMMILRKKWKIFRLLQSADSEEQRNILSEMNLYSLLAIWKKNKQIYQFDGDFLNELMRTDTLHFSKDAWKYLPCDTFYADISANQEICKKVGMQGFFCRVTEIPAKEVWQIHVLPVTAESIDYGSLFAWNKDKELKVQDIAHNELTELLEQESGEKCNGNPNASLMIAQILTYLSSVEPDIRQSDLPETTVKEEKNEKTASSHKKKKQTKPKDSALKKWTVGVRFGSAFRKWSNSFQTENSENSNSSETDRKVRPHHRNAHWQHYWYGKKNEERSRRPKWVAGCFVNLNLVENTDSLPAVIHVCGKE